MTPWARVPRVQQQRTYVRYGFCRCGEQLRSPKLLRLVSCPRRFPAWVTPRRLASPCCWSQHPPCRCCGGHDAPCYAERSPILRESLISIPSYWNWERRGRQQVLMTAKLWCFPSNFGGRRAGHRQHRSTLLGKHGGTNRSAFKSRCCRSWGAGTYCHHACLRRCHCGVVATRVHAHVNVTRLQHPGKRA